MLCHSYIMYYSFSICHWPLGNSFCLHYCSLKFNLMACLLLLLTNIAVSTEYIHQDSNVKQISKPLLTTRILAMPRKYLQKLWQKFSINHKENSISSSHLFENKLQWQEWQKYYLKIYSSSQIGRQKFIICIVCICKFSCHFCLVKCRHPYCFFVLLTCF